MRALIALGLVLGLLLSGCAEAGPPKAQTCAPKGIIREGGMIPDCTFKRLGGGTPIVLSAFKGKPLIINFWAAWCTACKAEIPAFQRVFDSLKDRLSILGMDPIGLQAEKPGPALAFARAKGVTYPLGSDDGGQLYAQFGTSIVQPIMPISIFFDAKGIVVKRVFGEQTESDLRSNIKAAFSIA